MIIKIYKFVSPKLSLQDLRRYVVTLRFRKLARMGYKFCMTMCNLVVRCLNANCRFCSLEGGGGNLIQENIFIATLCSVSTYKFITIMGCRLSIDLVLHKII